MYMQITRINRDNGIIFDRNKEPIESKDGLFRKLQKEFGRCVSHCYIDHTDGSCEKVGWVFEKLESYSDGNRTFLQETWVSIAQDYTEYCF